MVVYRIGHQAFLGGPRSPLLSNGNMPTLRLKSPSVRLLRPAEGLANENHLPFACFAAI